MFYPFKHVRNRINQRRRLAAMASRRTLAQCAGLMLTIMGTAVAIAVCIHQPARDLGSALWSCGYEKSPQSCETWSTLYAQLFGILGPTVFILAGIAGACYAAYKMAERRYQGEDYKTKNLISFLKDDYMTVLLVTALCLIIGLTAALVAMLAVP